MTARPDLCELEFGVMEIRQAPKLFVRAGSLLLQLNGVVLSKAGPGKKSGSWQLARSEMC